MEKILSRGDLRKHATKVKDLEQDLDFSLNTANDNTKKWERASEVVEKSVQNII